MSSPSPPGWLTLAASVLLGLACGVSNQDRGAEAKVASAGADSGPGMGLVYVEGGSQPGWGDLVYARGGRAQRLITTPRLIPCWIAGAVSPDRRYGAFLVFDPYEPDQKELQIYEFGEGDPKRLLKRLFPSKQVPRAMAWADSQLLLWTTDQVTLAWRSDHEDLSRVDSSPKPNSLTRDVPEGASIAAALPRWMSEAAKEITQGLPPSFPLGASVSFELRLDLQLLASIDGVFLLRGPLPPVELFGDAIQTDSGSAWLVSDGATHYRFECDPDGHVVARTEMPGPRPITFIRFGNSLTEAICGVPVRLDESQVRAPVPMGATPALLDVFAWREHDRHWTRVLQGVGDAWCVGTSVRPGVPDATKVGANEVGVRR